MQLSYSNITKFLIFQKKETLKISYIFGKSNFLALTLGNSYIFSKESFSHISGNENTEKIAYIISKKYVLIFQKNGNSKKFFLFQETSYTSKKVYSEPWDNETSLYFAKGIFRTLT